MAALLALTIVALTRIALAPAGGGAVARPGAAGVASAIAPAVSPPAATRSAGRRDADMLLSAPELVYGATAAAVDCDAVLRAVGSPIADARETFRGREASAGEIIAQLAIEHSIDPRVYIALSLVDPAVSANAVRSTFDEAGAWLSDGYYGAQYRGTRDVTFADDSRAAGSLDAGAAHFAVARYLALATTPDAWAARRAAFAAAFAGIVGPDPAPAVPPAPGEPRQPPLLLPWPADETWHFTGGAHGAWGIATAWAAVDFAPPTIVGCAAAPEWAVASAPGVVVHASDGLVLLDLDGDGNVGTGWVLAYMHMASEGRVAVGAMLRTGDRIGHPSCEGGRSSGAHVHLARRHDGEWVPVSGTVAPLELSGWSFDTSATEYAGAMRHARDGSRSPVAGGAADATGVTSDNGGSRRAEIDAVWVAPRDGARPTGTAVPPPPVVAAAARESGTLVTGTLAITIALGTRTSHATPLILGLARTGQPTSVVMAHTDTTGFAGPIALPPLAAGAYTLTVRAPGYLPAYVFGLPVNGAEVAVDLSAGGRSPLRAGDLTGDDVIDAADAGAWLLSRGARRAGVDVDGDGRDEWSDLVALLRNRSRASPGSGGGAPSRP